MERDWYTSNIDRIVVNPKFGVEKQPRYADLRYLDIHRRLILLSNVFKEIEQDRIDNKLINRIKRFIGW